MWNEKEQKMLLEATLLLSSLLGYKNIIIYNIYFDLKLIIANILVVSGVTPPILQQTSPVSSTTGVCLFNGLFCRTPWS